MKISLAKGDLNINKTVITIVMLNIIQLGSVIGIIFLKDSIRGQILKVSIFICGILSIVLLSGFVIFKDFTILNRHNFKYDMMKKSLEQMESLNNTLRAQRHDFMNHLQIIYSLMEMEEYKEAQSYIDKVFNDIQKVNKVLKTSNPAVNALLQAKLLYAEKKDVNMEISVTSQFKDLNMPSWEFCRVLGNIIDNGIYALQEKANDRCLLVELYEDIKMYRFRIKNNGPQVPENVKNKLFEAGFTTKGEDGQGMGLYIVKELVENYGGNISLYSDDNITIFEGCIKK